MPDKIYKELGESVVRVVTYTPEKQRAKLGYIYKGVYTVVDPDDQRFYFGHAADGGFIRARHYGKISPVADADVFVIKDENGQRFEPITNTWESGTHMGNDSAVGYHTHERASVFAYETDTWLLTGLRPTLSTGLVLGISTGFYKDRGVLRYFSGDTIDLTAKLPPTANYHRWAIIGLDTNSGVLTAYTSDEQFEFIDLNESDVPNIDIGDDLPLCFVRLLNGQTEIAESEIVDLRYVAMYEDELSVTSSEIVTLASGVGAPATHKVLLMIAAETGTADDLVTLTLAGQPRLLLLKADTGDTITLKHATGNIYLSSGLDFALSGNKTICLFYNGTNLSDIAPIVNITPLTADLDFDGNNATDVGTLNLDNSSELTIASGVITATQSWHRVDTEADSASDNLDTINGGADGTLLYLRADNSGRTVVIRHGFGNIKTFDEQDITLDTNAKCAALMYDGTLSLWLAIAIYNSSSGGSGGGAFAGDAYDVPYTPLDAGDWGVEPTNVGEALDEIASAISTNPQPEQWVNSTAENITSATYVAFTNNAEGTFVAPPTGKVYVTVSGRMNLGNSTKYGFTAWELREGSTIGSGTVTLAADDNRAIRVGNTVTTGAPNYYQGSYRHLVTGLVAGDTYNIRLMNRCSITLVSDFRAMLVEPVL